MKRKLFAFILAFTVSLSLFGCDATDGGEYATADFTFTVPETLRLLEYDENEYSGKVYTFCSADDEERVIKIREDAQANCTPAAHFTNWSDDTADVTDEIPNTPLPTYRGIDKEDEEDIAYMMVVTGCEGKLLFMTADLPKTDTNWFLLTTEEIAYTVAYHGEAIQAGKAENAYFAVSYSEQWVPYESGLDDEESKQGKLHLVYALAEDHCEQMVSVMIQALPDETRSPQEMTEALFHAESELRRDESIEEATRFGQQGWQYTHALGEADEALPEHHTQWTMFYFETQGKLYMVGCCGCAELHEQLLADMEQQITLTLK